MNVAQHADTAVSNIAAAIGEPARARMLYCLLDGHARTSTELAMVAEVSPSTASVHLSRLRTAHLIKVLVQGKHRYYSLEGADVAHLLEGLSVLAGGSRDKFAPGTPRRLCAARTCYDHLAGAVGVSLNDRFKTLRWLSASSQHDGNAYDLTPDGVRAFQALGIDLGATRTLRRRFAFACLDWSERRPHVGGALGAAILNLALKRRWVTQDLDSRVLGITSVGQRNARSIRASCLTVSSRAVRSLSSFVVTSSISRSSFCCDRMSCSAAHRNSSWLARIVGDNRLNLSVQAFLQSP